MALVVRRAGLIICRQLMLAWGVLRVEFGVLGGGGLMLLGGTCVRSMGGRALGA